MSSDWYGQLDVALFTKRRIVLVGNVYDRVFDREKGISRSFTDWLVVTLLRRKYPQVITYDHDVLPQFYTDADVDAVDLSGAGREMSAQGSSSDSSPALRDLRNLREALEADTACAVILSHADKAISQPALEAVALHKLTGGPGKKRTVVPPEAAGGTSGQAGAPVSELQSVAILLFARENAVPQDFLVSDPDTALIRVSSPAFEERVELLQHLRREAGEEALFQTEPNELAHKLEGWRNSEIEQLVEFDRQDRMLEKRNAGSLAELMAQFRAGRRIEYWASIQVMQLRLCFEARIKGQDEAINRIMDILWVAKSRLGEFADPTNRMPRLVIFALGPTGVGKTLFARTLAEAITGNPADNFKRFDMTEYQDRHEGQRLTGPPPGYVGHEEGGQATNFVASHPHSVVLFDEIEKGHSAMLDKLLHVLDSARMTDGRGVTVDFSDACLVFTSNEGAEEAAAKGLADKGYEAVREHFEEAFMRYCVEDLGRPELFGRLNHSVVVFNYISPDIIKAEVDRLLDQIVRGVQDRHHRRIEFDESVRAGVLSRVDRRWGLRGLNNTLMKHVLPEVGRFLEVEAGRSTGRRFSWDAKGLKVTGKAC